MGLEQTRLVVLDVDGVLAEGIYLNSSGEELKRFDARDGAGIKYLQREGVEVAILSGRESPAVEARARELGIERVVQNAKKKAPALEALAREAKVGLEEVVYMGDDLTDLPAISLAGFSASPSDAHEEVKRAVTHVCASPGGRGAVRELSELILRAKGAYARLLRGYGR